MLNKEIADAIKKSLPAQVGDVLKKRLTQADELESELDEKKSENKALKVRVDRLEKLNIWDNRLEERETVLNKLDEDINERMRNMDITVLQTKLDCAEDKAKAFHDFTTGLMRNIEYRSNAFGNTNRTDSSGISRADNYNHGTDAKAE